MKRLTLSASLLAGFTFAAPSLAAVTQDVATQLIRGTVDKAVAVLSNPALQGAENRLERHAQLRKISDEVFDWGAMAQRSLGIHWRSLDARQRTRFRDVFKELLAAHYLSQLDRFQGDEKVVHTGTEAAGKDVKVKMLLETQSRASVPIHFFVNGDKQVFDVAIEGVSLTNHYRGSFNRLLVNGSFESMMKRLEQKLAVQRRVEARAGGSEEG
ncbi:MAG: ABC transporter substrate-binding protein [Myxococcota bacterium]